MGKVKPRDIFAELRAERTDARLSQVAGVGHLSQARGGGSSLPEQGLALGNQGLCLLLIYRSPVEFSPLEHLLDLARYRVALSRPRGDLVFELRIQRVVCRVALEREGRDSKRALCELAEGRVDLLVNLTELQQ